MKFPSPISNIALLIKKNDGKIHEVKINDQQKKAILVFLSKQSKTGKLVIFENELKGIEMDG